MTRQIATLLWLCVACSADANTKPNGRAQPSATTSTGLIASAAPSNATTLIPVTTAGASASLGTGKPLDHCEPGAYTGTYSCKLVMQGMPTDTPIEGVVAFDFGSEQRAEQTKLPARRMSTGHLD